MGRCDAGRDATPYFWADFGAEFGSFQHEEQGGCDDAVRECDERLTNVSIDEFMKQLDKVRAAAR